MRTKLITVVLAGLLLGPFSLPADENLKNTDLKDGLGGWHGDGSLVFLKPDGTEGAPEDTGAIPVIKLELSHDGSRSVYQEFTIRDRAPQITYKVDVFVSSPVVRSTSKQDYESALFDYTPGSNFPWNAIGICNVDFWIRAGPDPDWIYALAQPVAGKWITVTDTVSSNADDNATRTILFCVPVGQGAVYLKNPSANSVGK